MLYKKIIKYFSLFAALIILILTISPFFLDKAKIVKVVNQKIKSEYNLNIDFDKDVEISFFPFPELQLKNVIFYDQKIGINLKVEEIQIISNWKSILKLKPDVKSLKLDSPILEISEHEFSQNGIIFVKTQSNSNLDSIRLIIKKFKEIKVSNGVLKFKYLNKSNTLEDFSLNFSNNRNMKVKSSFNYVEYKSFFKIKAETYKLNNIKYSINQSFENQNEVFGSGEINLDSKEIKLTGNFKSDRLNLFEISQLLTNLKFLKKKNIYSVKFNSPNLSADLNLSIDEINLDKFALKNLNLKVISKNNEILFKDIKAFHLKSLFKGKASYKLNQKKLFGNLSIYNFLVNKDFLGDTKFDITNASFDCDINFSFDNKKKVNLVSKKISSSGECDSSGATLVGMDIEEISNRIDNIQTFQDFFNLFNKKNLKGKTKIDSINFKFKIENNLLKILKLSAIQNNVKIFSSGQYSVDSKNINLKNDIFIKTKKFNNLPSFNVFVDGTTENYKISYNFDKIKSSVLSDGINSILKNKKKIVIDPKLLKGLIDQNSNKIKPDKIIDLFLD